MTASLPIHKVWFDRATRDALTEYVWRHRTDAGSIIRLVLQDIAVNARDRSLLSPNDGPSQVQKSVRVENEVWDAARDAAHAADLSINSAIRRRIRKMLEDEGFMA